MAEVLSITDVVQHVVQEALRQGGPTGAGGEQSSEIIEELQQEFPQATLVTLSMAELLNAVQESADSQDEEV
jgi:hypothetical protein